MEKSSYQKLRKKLDRIDFLSKYWIKSIEEELSGECPLREFNEGYKEAMERVQKWLNNWNEDEKGND